MTKHKGKPIHFEVDRMITDLHDQKSVGWEKGLGGRQEQRN